MRTLSIPLTFGFAVFMGGLVCAMPPAGAQTPAPPPAPPKAYKPVAVAPAEPMKDPSFEAFRKQIGEIAQKKDRAALAKLVAPNFFWQSDDEDKADKKKSGIDNLSEAIGLAGKDAEGWDVLANYAAEQTASASSDQPNMFCAPADPTFDDKALEDLAKATQTDPSEWGYPLSNGVEVHGTAQANSPVIEKLGMHFVRVMPDDSAASSPDAAPMLRIVAPSGKVGFVTAESVAPLGNDQICYLKEGSGWKIGGIIGAEQ